MYKHALACTHTHTHMHMHTHTHTHTHLYTHVDALSVIKTRSHAHKHTRAPTLKLFFSLLSIFLVSCSSSCVWKALEQRHLSGRGAGLRQKRARGSAGVGGGDGNA